jgi:hypothetical protein
MTKDNNWQNIVIILAMVTMPIAAAINFGAAAYDMLLPRAGDVIALIGGVSTGIGFECLGILAGHYAISYYGRNDKRWIIAAVVMLAYVVVGSIELWSIPLARFVPLLGGMVYVLSGLASDLTEVKQKETARAVFDLEQEAADNELARRLKVANAKLKHEERLAKIAAKPAAISQTTRRKSSNESAKHYECVCGRVFEGSRSYNAHRRHCDIPANEPARIYANGASK